MAKRSKPRTSKVNKKQNNMVKKETEATNNITITQPSMPPQYDDSDGKDYKFLLVGWGSALPNSIPKQFQGKKWIAERLDYAEQVKPDHKGYIVDMKMIEDSSVDVLWCPYILQRFYDQHIIRALAEAQRVIKEDGIFYSVVPDGQLAAAYIANDKGEEVIFRTNGGVNVTAYDIVYGPRKPLSEGKAQYANRSLFSVNKLGKLLQEAGFSNIHILRRGHELHISGYKCSPDNPNYVEKIVTSTDMSRAKKSPQAPKIISKQAGNQQSSPSSGLKDELDVPPVQWRD